MGERPDEVLYQPEQFPLDYQSSEQFKLDGVASGARGAVSENLIEVNNYPHILYGVRIVNTYELPSAFVVANPWFRAGLLLGGVDDEQKVFLDFAQQNITARSIHQRTLQGSAGINWHPFQVPYFLRGGNQVRIVITRLQPYPVVNDGAVPPAPVDIIPTAEVTLVTGVMVSDYFPASGAPSTEALPETTRHRRG